MASFTRLALYSVRCIFYALVPLLVLGAAIAVSCVLAFFIMKGVGDVIPFQKMISKSTQLLLILSIFPAMKLLNMDKEQLGFAARPVFFKQLLQGLGLGLLTLLPIFIVLYVLKINVFDATKVWTLGLVLAKLGYTLFLALLISLIEEPLFRGILLTGLSRKIPVALAIVISAIYYAALHFMDNNVVIAAQDVHFFTGFKLLKGAFLNVFNPMMFSSFISLMMVGIFLGIVRTQVKTSLGVCIGCHASWVWQIKMSKSLFDTNIWSDYIYLVGSYDAIVGPLVTGWLLLEIIRYFVYQRINKSR
ncbi:MAG: CPBP family intramembrane metalloprotease [Methylococcales bacterium]|nr:CPBP family intramembrane metalloprotease [Methylococcales bacterium]